MFPARIPKRFIENQGEERYFISHIANITIVHGFLNKCKICAKAPLKFRFSLLDMADIQGDVLTYPGRHFTRMVIAAAPSGGELPPAASAALERLRDWDYRASVDSDAMTIYFYAWRRLREEVPLPGLEQGGVLPVPILRREDRGEQGEHSEAGALRGP